MKAILMSIRPEWVAKILNGEKTIEIRKRFPKDYVGWVYIYCTQGRKLYDLRNEKIDFGFKFGLGEGKSNGIIWSSTPILNGRVVARFWCDKVDEIKRKGCDTYTDTMFESALLDKSCLYLDEICHYLKHEEWQEKEIVVGKAIHITNLEIFDKLKEISEFYTTRLDKELTKRFDNSIQLENGTWVKPLTRAPQSWQFIETGE